MRGPRGGPPVRRCRADGPLRIASIGRLLKQKRIDVLLRALQAQGRERAQLQLIGEGPEEPNLRRLVADLGLERSVVFRR